MMATWRSDLDRVLHVFNVRSIVSIWPLLTIYSQIELARNTQTAVSDVRHGVANTRTMAPGVRNDTANTPAIVSDTHHNTLRSLEGANSNLAVRTCIRLPRVIAHHCLGPLQVSGLDYQQTQYLTDILI